MKSKVTLKNNAMGKDGRVRNMRHHYRPSNLSAFPGKKVDNPTIAIRNILIYCEISHTWDKTDKETKESISKRFCMSLSTVNSIYYKTAERFRRWREEGLK